MPKFDPNLVDDPLEQMEDVDAWYFDGGMGAGESFLHRHGTQYWSNSGGGWVYVGAFRSEARAIVAWKEQAGIPDFAGQSIIWEEDLGENDGPGDYEYVECLSAWVDPASIEDLGDLGGGDSLRRVDDLYFTEYGRYLDWHDSEASARSQYKEEHQSELEAAISWAAAPVTTEECGLLSTKSKDRLLNPVDIANCFRRDLDATVPADAASIGGAFVIDDRYTHRVCCAVIARRHDGITQLVSLAVTHRGGTAPGVGPHLWMKLQSAPGPPDRWYVTDGPVWQRARRHRHGIRISQLNDLHQLSDDETDALGSPTALVSLIADNRLAIPWLESPRHELQPRPLGQLLQSLPIAGYAVWEAPYSVMHPSWRETRCEPVHELEFAPERVWWPPETVALTLACRAAGVLDTDHPESTSQAEGDAIDKAAPARDSDRVDRWAAKH